jgi:hypothetical protein
MTAIPMCFNCGTREVVGEFSNSYGEGFCSAQCEQDANEEFAEAHADYDYERKLEGDMDGEPQGSYDLSDDAEALASAGFGTDEDYGYYGGDEY